MDDEFHLPQPSPRSKLGEDVPDAFEPEHALVGQPKTLERYREILSRTSSTTKCRQMRNLAWVLTTHANARSTDFRVVTVGTRTAACGGPTAQTIRNANGADYRALIEVFAGEVQGSTKAVTKEVSGSGDDALLASIENLSARNHVRLLLHDCAGLRNQVNLLKHQIAREAPPMPTALSRPAQGNSPSAPQLILISKARRESIEHFVSESNMSMKRWRTNEYGALVDAFDVEIARPGFVDGLKQILHQLA